MKLLNGMVALGVLALAAAAQADIVRIASATNDAVYSNYTEYGGYKYNAWATEGEVNTAAYVNNYMSNMWWSRETLTAYLQINIAGLPAADQIDTVTLSLHLLSNSQTYQPTSASAYVYVHSGYASATGEATQKVAGNTLVRTFYAADGIGWLNIDVTNVILGNIAAGNNWAVISVSANATGYTTDSRNVGVTFSSGATDAAPRLIVALVPEPASLALIAVGALALIRRKR